MATSFEWIRSWACSYWLGWKYLLAMLVVFAPAVLLRLPGASGALHGASAGGISGPPGFIAQLPGHRLPPVFDLPGNGGLLRFACGLVLAVLLYASRQKLMPVLNYCWLWLVLNVFLLKP
jgi:hypothetical protein